MRNLVDPQMTAIKFEELGYDERVLLLRAFDYDVDEMGFILDEHDEKVYSTEIPMKALKVEETMFLNGSLVIQDGSPTAISKFIRERMDTPGTR